VLTTDSLTGLAALTAIAIVAGVIWTRARSGDYGRSGESEFKRVLQKGDTGVNLAMPSSIGKSARRRSGPLSASDLLTTVRGHQSRNAQRGEINLAINPSGDPGIHILVANLRDPDQLAPLVALNAVQDGCERIISTNPRADASDALKEALGRVDLVTNVGD